VSTPIAVDAVQIGGCYAPLRAYTVSLETFKQDADAAR
jgi:hypothetical protein